MRFKLLRLLLLCAAPALAGAGEVVDRIVAIVDREVITLSEAEQARELRLLRSDEEAPSLAEVVERLIEARLIERELERYPVQPIAPEELEAAEESVRRSFPSPGELDRALAAQGMDEEGLRLLLRRQLAISKYLDRRFRALVFITDDQIRQYYREELLPHLPEAEPDEPEIDPESFATIRRILEERELNRRIEEWIEGLKKKAWIRRYVW